MKVGKTQINIAAFAGMTKEEAGSINPDYLNVWDEIQSQLKLMSLEGEPKPKRKVKKEKEEESEEEGE